MSDPEPLGDLVYRFATDLLLAEVHPDNPQENDMTKPTTHVLLITDMSGSMTNLADDVRGGYNGYLDQLAADGGKYRITSTLFDTEFIPLDVTAKLKDATRLTATNYRPRGGTALRDAIGLTVTKFETGTTLGSDDRVLVVVSTDGHENSSREYGAGQIKTLIADREATGTWTFVYLGAGPNAWGQGEQLGMRSVNTAATGAGTQASYAAMATASGLYSRGATSAETVEALKAAEVQQ
jgi:hypothetical protein